MGMGMDRRAVLRLGFGVAASLAGASPAFGRAVSSARTLALDNIHTGERLDATYWERGGYLPDALAAIDRILRDHRTDEVTEMDTRLLDLLHALRATLGSRRRFEVFSGYRSPATNAALFEEGHGVAEHSFHIVGKAIDVRLPIAPFRCYAVQHFSFVAAASGTILARASFTSTWDRYGAGSA